MYEPLIAALNQRAGPSKAKDTRSVFTFAKDITHAIHYCAVREGILHASEHASCPPAFAIQLRQVAAGVTTSVNQEYLNQSVGMTVGYLSSLLRALESMSTGTGSSKCPSAAAIAVIHGAHNDFVARLMDPHGDLHHLDPVLLAADVQGYVQTETSRVQLAHFASTQSSKRPFQHAPSDAPSGSGRGRGGRGGRGLPLSPGGRGMPPPPDGSPQASIVCREHVRGMCARGSSCRFSHT